jgi:hypothetical protein
VYRPSSFNLPTHYVALVFLAGSQLYFHNILASDVSSRLLGPEFVCTFSVHCWLARFLLTSFYSRDVFVAVRLFAHWPNLINSTGEREDVCHLLDQQHQHKCAMYMCAHLHTSCRPPIYTLFILFVLFNMYVLYLFLRYTHFNSCYKYIYVSKYMLVPLDVLCL